MQDNPPQDTEAAPEEVKPEASEAPAAPGQRPDGHSRPKRTVLVRYGKMAFVGQFRHSEREIPSDATHVIVHTSRGIELGEIIAPFCHRRGTCTIDEDKIDSYCKSSGPDYPLSRQGRFLRFASQQDIKEQRHIEESAREKAKFCEELIAKHNLAMHLVTVEHLFGGDRIIYYFMADTRVDFRQLVKELANEYQTRIEMRQIGARDEARLIADFETCGRECCCKNFLKVLQPVNMRMAKLQKATLDPSKISGRCGRLKCCLRYEDRTYTELRKKLPHNNSTVLIEAGPGVVVKTQILTQLVRVRMDTGRVVAVSSDEILEHNYQRPEPSASPAAVEPDAQAQPRPSRPQPRPTQKEDAPQPQASQSTEQPDKPRRKRRRRRKKKKGPGGDSQASGQQSNPATPSGNQQ